MMAVLASVVYCYVGCNTGSPDKQALHVLECDTETGAAKVVQSVKDVQGTTYFQLDKAGKYLYSAIGEKRDTKTRGFLVRFPIADNRLGAMERLGELPCETPCHVSLTPDESRVAFASYCSATAGTMPAAGGEAAAFTFPDDDMGPNAQRQKKAYAHQTFYTPDGKRLGVVDLGCDRIWFFDPVTMKRDEALTIKFDPGDGPRHAVWSKDNRFLFVVNELGSSVSSFELTQLSKPSKPSKPSKLSQPLSFRKVGKWSALPKGFDGETKAAAIKLTADGKILMASNRGHDSIAFYDVRGDGSLSLRNIAKLNGKFPRDFELMPGEKFMIVGHKMSNEIQVYAFDRAACTLTAVGAPIAAWRPLCFKFGR